MWILFAFLSNGLFSCADMVAYHLTAAGQTYNALAVGAAMHLWVSVTIPVLLLAQSVFARGPSMLSAAVKQTTLSAQSAGILLPVYALLSFFANGMLYRAYALGARESDINPGVAATLSNLSLIISASLPVLFYGASLSPQNILGVVLYLIGAYYLVDTSKKDPAPKKEKPREDKDVLGSLWWQWLYFSVGAGVLYGFAAFAAYVITRNAKKSQSTMIGLTYCLYLSQACIGLALVVLSAIFPGISAGGLLTGYTRDLVKLFSTWTPAVTTLAGGMTNAAGVTALFKSYLTAPNPGFADAISNLYTGTFVVLSWMVYGTALNQRQIFGMLVAAVSIVLLSS